MSLWGQLFFQDSNSPIIESMIMFYDHVMLVVVMIINLIFYILIYMFKNKYMNRFMFEGQMIEMIWTLVPMVFLMFIAFPSLKVLYMIDESNSPILSIKVLGHQWYWSYELCDFKFMSFDSFMIDNLLELSNFRLVDVDNRLVLPINNQIRVLVSSMDVIHSFALPSMGLKIDGIPGRINQMSLIINRPGLFYGQCSEICGVNHSFMPIVIESVNFKIFMNWILNNSN